MIIVYSFIVFEFIILILFIIYFIYTIQNRKKVLNYKDKLNNLYLSLEDRSNLCDEYAADVSSMCFILKEKVLPILDGWTNLGGSKDKYSEELIKEINDWIQNTY